MKFNTKYDFKKGKGLVCSPEMPFYELSSCKTTLVVSKDKKLKKQEQIQMGMNFINGVHNYLKDTDLVYGDTRVVPKDPYEYSKKLKELEKVKEKTKTLSKKEKKKIAKQKSSKLPVDKGSEKPSSQITVDEAIKNADKDVK